MDLIDLFATGLLYWLAALVAFDRKFDPPLAVLVPAAAYVLASLAALPAAEPLHPGAGEHAA